MRRFLYKQKPVKRHILLAGEKAGETLHRTAGWICFGFFLAGAIVLVSYAISSPELPPANLVSTLNTISEDSAGSGNMASVVILPSSEEKTWVSLSGLKDEELATGAGNQEIDRTRDIEYHTRPGETLSEIAYSYNIPYEALAFYNNIKDVHRIQVGTVIRIPSLANTKTAVENLAKKPTKQAAVSRHTTKNAVIAFESRNNGDKNRPGIIVQFSIVSPPEEDLQSIEWDFGDGKRGFRPSPSYEYTDPKTYVVRLTARGANGVLYKSNPLYIDVPHPELTGGNIITKFVTLASPDDVFIVDGNITEVARYPSVEAAPLDFSESDQFLTKVRFKNPGYYGLTVMDAEMVEQYYSIFVSPFPTIHADAFPTNLNWYRTQYNTGASSNCGPAVASMAIGWSLGKYQSVASVRQAVGWQGNGGISFSEILDVIRAEGIAPETRPFRSVQDLKDIIDDGNIAIVLIHTGGLTQSQMSPDKSMVGKYYNDEVGHYIVIKGYSLNGEYFVTYDPIPNDWTVNSFRYADDLSMVGRNRYYNSHEILRALRRYEMIVVPRNIQ
jgi:PKD repeat protein/LysM repeat protein